MTKHGADAGAASQIFMRDDPSIEVLDDELGQDSHEATLADWHLHDTNP